MDRVAQFPVGASVTVEQLTQSPYEVLARLRANEPVSWVPATNAWFVTQRDLAVLAMRDAKTFTVDDERFTTARVLGTSMLSLDGPEHTRHRRAFTAPFRPKYVREVLEARIVEIATRLVESTMVGSLELRNGVAGPLAVETVLDVLGMEDIEPTDVLSWYNAFGDAIVALTVGDDVPDVVHATLAQLYQYVGDAMGSGDAGLVTQLVEDQILTRDEIPAAVAVVMFGAIETSEGMTSTAFWHLFTNPGTLTRLRADRSLIPKVINESLRLEPAAAVVDRYTATEVTLGDVTIPQGELITVSLLGANRDPVVFPNPDTFDIDRPNAAKHVTWAVGPHACMGLHVAKAETTAAISAFLDLEARLGRQFELDQELSSSPTGLIFRKPGAVRLSAN